MLWRNSTEENTIEVRIVKRIRGQSTGRFRVQGDEKVLGQLVQPSTADLKRQYGRGLTFAKDGSNSVLRVWQRN